MQRESLNETREQSREDKGEDGERKLRPPPLRAKEKKIIRLYDAYSSIYNILSKTHNK